MVRSIFNGTTSPTVLNQLNAEEIRVLTNLVDKKGHKTEKAELMELLSGNSAKGDSVNVDLMKNSDKLELLKSVVTSEHIDESRLSDLISKMNKDIIFDLVNKNDLTDKQLTLLARHTDGDKMADNPDVAEKMLMAMIRSYTNDPQSVTTQDINNFINEIDKDWTKDDDIMKNIIENLGDGPNSLYAKLQALSPATIDNIRRIARG